MRGKFSKEFVWGRNLLLQIFFSASDGVVALGAELVEIVFEPQKIALHIFKVVLVSLEVHLLLFGNLFPEVYLLIGFFDLGL